MRVVTLILTIFFSNTALGQHYQCHWETLTEDGWWDSGELILHLNREDIESLFVQPCITAGKRQPCSDFSSEDMNYVRKGNKHYFSDDQKDISFIRLERAKNQQIAVYLGISRKHVQFGVPFPKKVIVKPGTKNQCVFIEY